MQSVEHLGCLRKEAEVELHDISATAVILAQGQQASATVVEVAAQAVCTNVAQDVPVAATPPIDTLLHIAHQEGGSSPTEHLVEQGQEVLPLQVRRILELIYHHMTKANTSTFQHEERVGSLLQDASQQDGCHGQQNAVDLAVDAVDLAADAAKHAQLAQMLC